MGYYDIGLKYPRVRREEIALIDKYHIYKATQTPSRDAFVQVKKDDFIGLSFINLHHFTDREKREIADRNLYNTHHIFEVPKFGANSIFLDMFISKYSRRKHKGYYIDYNTFDNLKHTRPVGHKLHKLKWYLPENIAKEYLKEVFFLDRYPDLELLSALDYDGESFNWPILYTKLEKYE